MSGQKDKTFKNIFFPNTKFKIIFYIILPILATGIAFSFYYKPPFELINPPIDKNKTGINIKTYNDKEKGGKSIVSGAFTEQTAEMKYMLKKNIQYPFTGITFFLSEGLMDLSDYDKLTVNIKAKKGRRLPLIINTYVKGFSDSTNFDSHRFNQYILNVDNEFRDITIDFSSLSTPEWWFTMNNTREEELPEPDFSRVRSVTITNCMEIPKGAEDTVQIRKISFYVNMQPFFIYIIVGWLLYGIIGLLIFRRPGKQIIELNFQYEKLETENQFEKEEKVLFDYLSSAYYQSNLSLKIVQQETGISEQKISGIIRDKTGLNFRQFLNRLRMTEAKRLLKESDKQISEIAYETGYERVSHFNRVFREQEGCPPGEFRKKELIQN